MTILNGREQRALVVIDLQNGVVNGAYRRNDVIHTVTELVAKARAAGVPVIWVQHNNSEIVRNSEEWQWVEELGPAKGEYLVEKTFGDAFEETNLEKILSELDVAEIILVGACSEQCIRCTMHSAVIRGYDLSLVKGAHTTVDLTEYGMPTPEIVISFIDQIASFGMEWPGRSGRSVTPAEVEQLF
ncbi:MAG: isochorismatase family protein [Micrococcaceae bacterium]